MGFINGKKNILDILLDAKIINADQFKAARSQAEALNADPLGVLIQQSGAEREKIIYFLSTLDDGLLFLDFLKRSHSADLTILTKIESEFDAKESVERELISAGAMGEEDLAQNIAKYYEIDFVTAAQINNENVNKFFAAASRDFFYECEAAVADFVDNCVSVYAADTRAYNKVKLYAESLEVKVKFFAASYSLIESMKGRKTDSAQGGGEPVETFFSSAANAAAAGFIIEKNDILQDLTLSGLSIEKRPVVKLLNTIIYNAVEKSSSDIHFEVYGCCGKIKYRIDGVLIEALKDIPAQFFQQLISRIKIMAGLDISEHRVPQDGRFELKIDEKPVDFRVSVLPSIHGETAVIRILNQQTAGYDLSGLGLCGADLKKFNSAINKPYGMVLVSGPTGSGKTTTLYSAIKSIARISDKIITIEDPVEYQMEDIVQIPVNEKKGLTFSKGLRSIVRQDPDKIMVGEIRDAETAQIAVNAALTGHMVFSSIHANNVIDTISRLLNLGIEPYQFAASFNLIVAQRLVRKLCPLCKKPDDGNIETLAPEFKGLSTFIASGCRQCSSIGYRGRTAIFEVLEMNDNIRQMIIDGVSPLKIKLEAQNAGMRTLRQAAIDKVAAAVSSIEEINRVTFE